MDDRVIEQHGGMVRVVKRQPHDVIVQVRSGDGWMDREKFHEVSDDWAFTNARDAAERRARAQTKPEVGA